MSETRSSILLSVLERLRAGRRLGEDELGGLVGAGGDVEALVGVLVEAGLGERSGKGVAAAPAVDGTVNVEKLALIEEYALGEAEAADFRRLMGFLVGADEGGGQQAVGEIQPPADPETLKKYVREFIDPQAPEGGGEAG
jgi:hypothetical protein